MSQASPAQPVTEQPGSVLSAVTTESASGPIDASIKPSPIAISAVSQVSHIAQVPTTPASLPSTNAPTSTPSAAVTPATEDQIDPNVAGLQAMFPDFDITLLESVLEACDGDFERAVDVLLGMSDPGYKSQAPPPPQATQEDLDEQLARRLFLEDQQQYQQEQAHPPRHQDTGAQVPYQVRQHHPAPHGDHGQPSSAGTDIRDHIMGFINTARGVTQADRTRSGPSDESGQGPDFRQQFSEIAETGKKTFASLVTKVKSKIQEFENPPPANENPGRHSHQQQQWNTWTSAPSPPSSFTQDPIATHQQAQTRPVRQGMPQRQDPALSQTAQSLGGYQVNNAPTINAATVRSTSPTTVPASASVVIPGAAGAGIDRGVAPSTSAGTAGPSEASTRPSFDTSRLGLKPKRPVSLVNTHNSPEPIDHARRKDSDADSLEYVTSPFEDR